MIPAKKLQIKESINLGISNLINLCRQGESILLNNDTKG